MIVMYIFAYVLLTGFFLMERYVRQGKDTKNMSRTKSDKGSTKLISIAMGTLFILIPVSPLFNYINFGRVANVFVGIAGVLLGFLGLIVRYLAFTKLGCFFTRTLRKADGHMLITSGIYHYIRHPGYLSDILIFIGASLAMGNLIPIIGTTVLFLIAYSYRIHIEEKMLIEMFGEEYIAYKKVSKRLIPYVF